jgi:hypothetical protein
MMPFPSFFFPGAGGNWQTIDTRWWSPTVSVNFAGNPTVEREVVEDVASYGRQIGWLNDIVMALVGIEGRAAVVRDRDAADALQKLDEAHERIKEIKARRKDNALEAARGALANLGTADKAAYTRLVNSLDPDTPPSTS